MKFFWILLVAFFLCSCSSVEFSSNLDPRVIGNYFKTSTVDEYTEEDLVGIPYKDLGSVDGFVCQVKPTDFIAKEDDAKTEVLKKAADIGANGVIFTKCMRAKETLSCNESVTCYARAILILEE